MDLNLNPGDRAWSDAHGQPVTVLQRAEDDTIVIAQTDSGGTFITDLSLLSPLDH